jgi:hypothetical protein
MYSRQVKTSCTLHHRRRINSLTTPVMAACSRLQDFVFCDKRIHFEGMNDACLNKAETVTDEGRIGL